MNRPLPNYVVLKDLGGCQGHRFVVPSREPNYALLSGLPDLGRRPGAPSPKRLLRLSPETTTGGDAPNFRDR
jgi:hypothetical protein